MCQNISLVMSVFKISHRFQFFSSDFFVNPEYEPSSSVYRA